jgi:hypothetical protein
MSHCARPAPMLSSCAVSFFILQPTRALERGRLSCVSLDRTTDKSITFVLLLYHLRFSYR